MVVVRKNKSWARQRSFNAYNKRTYDRFVSDICEQELLKEEITGEHICAMMGTVCSEFDIDSTDTKFLCYAKPEVKLPSTLDSQTVDHLEIYR